MTANDFQPSFIGADSSSKQCPGIYPAQLVGGRRPPSPPVHRRSSARCTSRRQRLLVYIGRGGHPGGAAPGGRTAAVYTGRGKLMAEPNPVGRTMAEGHTTTSLRVVSKCALSRGPTKRTERPGHPRTLPLRFPPAGKSPSLHPVPFCHK